MTFVTFLCSISGEGLWWSININVTKKLLISSKWIVYWDASKVQTFTWPPDSTTLLYSKPLNKALSFQKHFEKLWLMNLHFFLFTVNWLESTSCCVWWTLNNREKLQKCTKKLVGLDKEKTFCLFYVLCFMFYLCYEILKNYFVR